MIKNRDIVRGFFISAPIISSKASLMLTSGAAYTKSALGLETKGMPLPDEA
jgi:hypothetical protein